MRPDQVQAFYTKKLNEELSKRTVQYIQSVLHKSLNQVPKWGLVSRNVTDLVEKPRSKRKTFATWSADQVNHFLEAVSDHRWYPIYILAISTGMRKCDILGLHREDMPSRELGNFSEVVERLNDFLSPIVDAAYNNREFGRFGIRQKAGASHDKYIVMFGI